MLTLVLRLVLAMGAVLAVMWVAARVLQRRTTGARRRPGAGTAIEVLGRRGLGRSSSVAVVRAGGRTMVLGVTDHTVTLLAEADPASLEPEPLGPGGTDGGTPPGWEPGTVRTQLLDALRERTVRR